MKTSPTNILFINLKRYGDIFNMAHTIKAYKQDNPESKISVLVFKEFVKAANAINHIDEVFTIDREQILTFKKNQIFSDGLALNLFENEIHQLKRDTHWDIVFNYSNDRVSTHITSLLKEHSTKHMGIRFNSYCNVEYSNEWALLFNDVLTDLKYSPVSFVDTYNQIATTELKDEGIPLKTKEEYNKTTHLNFSEIRRMEEGECEIKIIGVQVSASSNYKMIPRSELIALIDELYMTPEYFPVLLGAPTERDREIINDINSEFNNSLVSIEADFIALSSVLLNLDALVTPDTSVKHVADLLKVPTVEISLGESPLFKQGTMNLKSVIVTPHISLRSFKKKEVEGSRELKDLNYKIKYTDIISALQYIMGEISDFSNEKISHDVTIYQPHTDGIGRYLMPIAGDFNEKIELERLCARALIHYKTTNKDDLTLLDKISTFDSSLLSNWIEHQKNAITDTSRDLLATLRGIIQLTNEKSSINNFLQALAVLFERCDDASDFIKIPAIRFRSRLEALNTSDLSASAKEVEGLLYEYKSDIQFQVEVIKTLQERMRKNTTTRKRNTSRTGAHDGTIARGL